MRRIVLPLSVALVLVGCAGSPATAETQTAETAETTTAQSSTAEIPTAEAQSGEAESSVAAVDTTRFPTVVDAVATTTNGTSWQVDVTLSSEYDSPERYADAWRVLDADDNELGIRVLTHDHAGEQPFTRSATVEIPEALDRVFVEGRDQLNGWNGERFELILEP